MYAIIEDSGRQFKVTSGDRIRLDRPLTDQQGQQPEKLTLDRVLLVAGEGAPKIGAPLVSGAKVEAEVLGWVKGKKIDIQKYKRRKGYHRKQGHRQNYLEVKITSITA
jgi:large subunit ribosomal protein L21